MEGGGPLRGVERGRRGEPMAQDPRRRPEQGQTTTAATPKGEHRQGERGTESHNQQTFQHCSTCTTCQGGHHTPHLPSTRCSSERNQPHSTQQQPGEHPQESQGDAEQHPPRQNRGTFQKKKKMTSCSGKGFSMSC